MPTRFLTIETAIHDVDRRRSDTQELILRARVVANDGDANLGIVRLSWRQQRVPAPQVRTSMAKFWLLNRVSGRELDSPPSGFPEEIGPFLKNKIMADSAQFVPEKATLLVRQLLAQQPAN